MACWRTHRHIGEGPIEAAGVADRFTVPELAQEWDGFSKAGATFLARDAADFVLSREFTADTDAEDQAAFGEMVES